MINSPFVKISCDIRSYCKDQRDQPPDRCWDNVVLKIKTDITNNLFAVLFYSHQHVFFAKKPNLPY